MASSSSSRVYRNLTGKLFTEPEVGSWYNLETGRRLTKAPKGCSDFIFCDNPRVAGKTQTLEAFHKIQKGLVADHVKEDDVEKLSETLIECIPSFSLAGLNTKAKVTKIVDGDTLHIIFYVPLEYMLVLKSCGTQGGFFTKMSTRLDGFDAAESGTAKGRKAKELLTDRIESLKNIIHIKILGFDIRGRLLAQIFEDEEFQKDIKDYMLNYTDPLLGKIAVPYNGGKRQEWPTTPPRN